MGRGLVTPHIRWVFFNNLLVILNIKHEGSHAICKSISGAAAREARAED
jgi:hypothetical protein